MSPRIVVTVEETGSGDLQVLLLRAQRAFDDAHVAQRLTLDPDTLPPLQPPDGVRRHGQAVYQALTQHGAIQSALEDAIARNEPTPIYFRCMSTEAERVAWEALCDDTGQFFALRRNLPVGRIAESHVDLGGGDVSWQPPLRIFAVLSALPFPAEREWDYLHEAVQTARNNGLQVEVSVMVGEEALLETIRGLNDPGITARPVSDLPIDIEDAIDDFQPQLVHFFCHGSASFGEPVLELASLRDWTVSAQPGAGQDGHGSIELGVKKLVELPAINGVWLVTLNCCEGGRATEDVHSLAHSLVSGGVAAAVGMAEPVDASDAHEFSRRFYPEVLNFIGQQSQQAQVGDAFEVEWSTFLYPSRSALSQRGGGDPEAARRWVLPILYALPERFRVRRSSVEREVARGAAVHADFYSGFIDTMPDDTPDHIMEGARALLEATETRLFGADQT